MNKKILTGLTLTLCSLFVSCEQTSVDVSNDISSNSSLPEISSSIEEGFDESKYQEHQFLSVNELYLIENETYDLSKMLLSDDNNYSLNYLSDFNEAYVNENGVITANSLNGELLSEGYVYVYDDSKLQKVKVNVVDYYEYGSYFTTLDVGRLYGKKIMFFGASNTHNWSERSHERPDPNVINDDPRDFKNHGTNYVAMLNEVCNFEMIVNAAWSGGTMSYPAGSNIRYTYKSFAGSIHENEEAVSQVDYIIVNYGTNDLMDQVPIGTLADEMSLQDKKSSTFLAGMKYGINKIKEINPDVTLVFMNVMDITANYTRKIKVEEYNNAINECATAAMCKVLDTHSLFTEEEFVAGSKLTDDGLHLSIIANKILTNYILTGKNNKEEYL